jgi:hypothetical protein
MILGFLGSILGFHSLIFDISILAIARKEKWLKLVEQALAPKTKKFLQFCKQASKASKQASTREAAVAVAGGFMVVVFFRFFCCGGKSL